MEIHNVFRANSDYVNVISKNRKFDEIWNKVNFTNFHAVRDKSEEYNKKYAFETLNENINNKKRNLRNKSNRELQQKHEDSRTLQYYRLDKIPSNISMEDI